MSFVTALLLAAQAAPLPPPMVSIDAITDSAERQTLPEYRIDCSLIDEGANKLALTLRQTGGRGVKGTRDELWSSLPAWRRFVRTPVRVEVLNDQAKLFDFKSIEVNVPDDALRWDANLNGYARSSVGFRQRNDKIVSIQILGHTSNSEVRAGQSHVAVAFNRSSVSDWRQQVQLLGFCSVSATPQRPLTAAEESEFRKK